MVFEIWDRTDRQTGTLITKRRTPPGGEVISGHYCPLYDAITSRFFRMADNYLVATITISGSDRMLGICSPVHLPRILP